MSNLPSPHDRNLSPGRHRDLREYLMNEIRQETKPVRSRWRRPAFAAPAIAAAMSVAVVVGLTVTRDGDDEKARPEPATETAASFFERLAEDAEKRSALKVRDDQFVYTEREDYHWKMDPGTRWPDNCSGTDEGYPHGVEEIWNSVDDKHEGFRREWAAKDMVTEFKIEPQWPDPPQYPNYRGGEGLPTDPDAMYRRLYDLEPGEQPSGKRADDMRAFANVGELLSDYLLPPKTSAALYRAAARIPGLTLQHGVKDIANRPGVAVTAGSFAGKGQGLRPYRARNDLIFSERNLTYLGHSTVNLTAPNHHCDVLEAGAAINGEAVLTRGVVDKPKQLP
ncbi:CU044_5270 family protein [Streptomyces sp. T-3]|nr:CU044_5270 family protein [Streptomyces sp. T-3]